MSADGSIASVFDFLTLHPGYYLLLFDPAVVRINELQYALDQLDDKGIYLQPLSVNDLKTVSIVDPAPVPADFLKSLIWTCGCGIVNGVNLRECRVCGKIEFGWERP